MRPPRSNVAMRDGSVHFAAFFGTPANAQAPLLPVGAGCGVYVSLDDKPFEYVGCISADLPSRFFRITADRPAPALLQDAMVDDEAEVAVEEHTLQVGLELGPLQELLAKKAEHDSAKRERAFWAKEVLVQTNRVPDATNPASFAAFASAVVRDAVDFLGSFARGNLVPLQAPQSSRLCWGLLCTHGAAPRRTAGGQPMARQDAAEDSGWQRLCPCFALTK